jgi:polar amino acid transport system substrate-binding protein
MDRSMPHLLRLPGKGLPATLLLALACVRADAAPLASLAITTELAPPASMLKDGKVVGSGTDKVREMMVRTRTPYTIELLPWKRAYAEALAGQRSCVYSTTRTPEREALFKWVGPTDAADWVLLGRADRPMHLKTLEDARGLRIGTYHGDARNDYLRERGFKVDPAPKDWNNPEKLMMNRIDLWAASLRKGQPVLEQHGLATRIVPVLTFNQIKVYLACNRAVPDALIKRLNAALEAMERDGTSDRIERKYANWRDSASPVARRPASK